MTEHIETPLGWALPSVGLAHSVKELENDVVLNDGETLFRDCVLIVLMAHHRSGSWRGPGEPAAPRPWHCAPNQSGTCARDKLVSPG